MSDTPESDSIPTGRIAEVLRKHALSREDRRAWWCTCGADCLNTEGSHWKHAAEAVVAALPPSPPRMFVDDLGQRWEWCGGAEGTWAWRITEVGVARGSSSER